MEFREAESGPGGVKPIQVEFSSREPWRITGGCPGTRIDAENWWFR